MGRRAPVDVEDHDGRIGRRRRHEAAAPIIRQLEHRQLVALPHALHGARLLCDVECPAAELATASGRHELLAVVTQGECREFVRLGRHCQHCHA